MRFTDTYLREAEKLLSLYKGQEPFHVFSKKYFRKNKNFGSRDRRYITQFCYSIFRIGRENRKREFKERVMASCFLQGFGEVEFYHEYPDYVANFSKSFPERYLLVQNKLGLENSFQSKEELSDQIDPLLWRQAFYKPPNVYARLFNDVEHSIEKLEAKEVKFKQDGLLFSFDKKTNLASILEEKDFVIQDKNSHSVCEHFVPEDGQSWYDCCAGSGGKSLALLEYGKDIDLTVSDIRPGILENLKARFNLYGHEQAELVVLNINKENHHKRIAKSFDRIICDVPCTGSGTWARNPEQAWFFDKKQVGDFHKKQLDILSNAYTFLKPGGILFYITCSIFSKENEEVVKTFKDESSALLQSSLYLKGYEERADSLFLAKIEKPA